MSEISDLLEQAKLFKDSTTKDIDVILRENLLKLNAAKDELHKLHNKKMAYMEECEALIAESKKLKDDNEQLRLKKKEFDVEIRKERAALDEESIKLDERKRLSQEETRKNEQLRYELESHERKIKAMSYELSGKLAEADDFSMILEDKNVEVDRAKERVMAREKEWNDKNRQIDTSLDQINTTRKELAKEAQKYEELAKATQDEKARYVAANQKIDVGRARLEADRKEVMTQKARLMLSQEKCEEETELTRSKQRSLDNNLVELKNEYNRLEVLRLKIEKLIMDNNTIKDLQALRNDIDKGKK